MTQLPPIEINPDTFLKQHCTLPALPMVVNKIQEVIRGDNVDIQKVIDLISGDPSLVAQIFKVVNSGYYGLPREITKIQFAIAFLGLNEVYRMVLSLAVINTIAVDSKEELNNFWFHSFYSAICAKHLAKKYEPQLSFEELWSAAILHDIGKLVYLKFYTEHYKELRNYSNENGCLFSQAEDFYSLPASAYLGGLLCDHWRLPNQIKEACMHHTLKDLPSATPDSPTGAFRRMICLGNLMSTLSSDDLKEETKHDIAGAITASLGCSDSDFLAIMGEIYDLRIEVDQFMGQLN